MKKNAKAKNELPELVTVMAKLVEKLDILEKKTDQAISRLASLPSQLTHIFQDLQRPSPAHHTPAVQRHEQGPSHSQPNGPRERIMYKAVCADCCKNCEVPFRPTEDRPVYCKECFAIRKAGHRPQDPDKRVATPPPQKKNPAAPPVSETDAKEKKQKAAAKGGKKGAKKKKK